MKRLIINADDFGLTDGICRSVAELFELNAISSTTLMVCVEGARQRCRTFLAPSLSRRVGVHLQIAPERHHRRPLSPASEIPTLVDPAGQFKPKDHTDWINPAEVELEWERQILAAAEILGHLPSHLDSHHGKHRVDSITPVYLKLAAKYKLPVRGGRSIGQIDGSPYRVKSTTLCDGDWTGQNKTLADLKQTITTGLSQLTTGVLEIVTHPGYCDEDLMNSSSWNTVRENDRAVLKSLAAEGWLSNQQIELITFDDL